jgi:hypothetical protein
MAALEMSNAARQLTVAGFRERHPEWSSEHVELATAALLLGPELVPTVLAPGTAAAASK